MNSPANPVTLPLSLYSPKHFLLAVVDGIATVTLNRPERKNPLTFESYRELTDFFRACAMDDEVKTVVVTGAGGNFSSGGDVFEIIGPLVKMDTKGLTAFTRMMVIFFLGIGASMISVGLVQTPLQLGAALLSIGLFASIYHPVGTAMIVSYADKLGREMGLNGVWGNLGVASSALVTGVIGQYLGWRFAFIIPGVVTMLIGIAFATAVVHEDRKGSKQAAAQARVAKQDMAGGSYLADACACSILVSCGSIFWPGITRHMSCLATRACAAACLKPARSS